MNNHNTVKIYVSVLEEGTPTYRPTQAIDLGQGLYKILATPNYDPEDEIWEFVPEEIVMGKHFQDENGLDILVAVRKPVTRDEILKPHMHAKIGEICIPLRDVHQTSYVRTEGIDLGGGLYKVLPTPDYDVLKSDWEFSPSSVVRAIPKTDNEGHKILWAFDQIREDRIQEHYARSVLKNEV